MGRNSAYVRCMHAALVRIRVRMVPVIRLPIPLYTLYLGSYKQLSQSIPALPALLTMAGSQHNHCLKSIGVRCTRHNVSEDDTWIPGALLTSCSSLLDTLRFGGSEADLSETTLKRPRYETLHKSLYSKRRDSFLYR